jgi:hypothetical protein
VPEGTGANGAYARGAVSEGCDNRIDASRDGFDDGIRVHFRSAGGVCMQGKINLGAGTRHRAGQRVERNGAGAGGSDIEGKDERIGWQWLMLDGETVRLWLSDYAGSHGVAARWIDGML